MRRAFSSRSALAFASRSRASLSAAAEVAAEVEPDDCCVGVPWLPPLPPPLPPLAPLAPRVSADERTCRPPPGCKWASGSAEAFTGVVVLVVGLAGVVELVGFAGGEEGVAVVEEGALAGVEVVALLLPLLLPGF